MTKTNKYAKHLQLKKLVETLGDKYLPTNANDISTENSHAWIAPVINGDINTADIQSGRDVYDLLETDEVQDMASHTDLLALFTCGWASPIQSNGDDDDLPPSQHPERKRVALLVFANRKQQLVTAMRMGSDELMVNDEGRGALGDALLSLMG